MKLETAALTVAIRSDPRYLPWLRAVLVALRRGLRPRASSSHLWRAGLVLTEAINNAIAHAHGRDMRRWIEVRIRFHARRCTLTVIDTGRAFGLPRRAVMPGPEQCQGRGLPLIQQWCRQCRVVRRARKNYFTMVCHV
ncbi:MAG: ATP-binding protein [Deltaproteobacteria bacterium]|nr:ATP-binding protein [Deltaproteobacteria bacterium]